MRRRGVLWCLLAAQLLAAVSLPGQGKRQTAQGLADQGAEADAKGDAAKALGYYLQALPLRRSVADRSGETSTLKAIARLYSVMGDQQKAAKYYMQALALEHEAGDRTAEATTLNNIGAVYSALGEKQKALEYLNEALRLRRTAGDQAGQAMSLNSVGAVYSDLGQQQKALEYFNQALPLSRAGGRQADEAYTLNHIGGVYSVLGEKQKALEYYDDALRLRRTARDGWGEATSLNSIGLVYFDLGQRHKALEYYVEALPLWRAVRVQKGEAATLHNIGGVYSALGEKQKALEYYGRALRLHSLLRNRQDAAGTLISMGVVYGELGEKQKALEYYNRALPLARAAASLRIEAVALNNLGQAYFALGEKQKALEYFDLALLGRRAAGDRVGEALTLNNIGEVHSRSSSPAEKQKALEYLRKALARQDETGDRSGAATSLNNIGGVYSALGDTEKALEYFGGALPLEQAIGDRSHQAATLNNISKALAKSQPEAAIFFAKQAVNVLQTLRRDNQALQDDLRRSYEGSIAGTYRRLAGLLVDGQRFGEAEEVLNLLKDKEAADFIRRDAVSDQLKSAALNESEKKALERYEKIQTDVILLGQERSLLLAKGASSDGEKARLKQLRDDLDAANSVLRLFLMEQEKTFPANSVSGRRMVDLKESQGLQDGLQKFGPGAAAIYTLVLPESYTAILITGSGRKAYTTKIAEAELNRKIFQFRKLLQNPGSDPLQAAQELYKIVFPEGLRQDLDQQKTTTIMWSVDSTLRYIPMAALHDGKQYMVSVFRNSLITPASLARLAEQPVPSSKGLGFGVSKAGSGFSALPGVPAELGGIFEAPGQPAGQAGKALSPMSGPVLMDAEFTRDSFRDALEKPDKAVVHIATHFDARPGDAADSRLLLGDGPLSLQDIEKMENLFRGVDLLTLSACSTAVTEVPTDGREVDSLGTIAQRLGARGVIASLWSVSDDATSGLMQTMYRLRQSQPALGKGEHLRLAQQKMVSGELKPNRGGGADREFKASGSGIVSSAATGWAHPFYWAPFILIGNWQ